MAAGGHCFPIERPSAERSRQCRRTTPIRLWHDARLRVGFYGGQRERNDLLRRRPRGEECRREQYGRLMAGSLGALGIITQATLLVRPMPEAAALLACEVADFVGGTAAGESRSPAGAARGRRTVGRAAADGNPLLGPMSTARRSMCIGFEGSPRKSRGCWTGFARSGRLGAAAPVLMPNVEKRRRFGAGSSNSGRGAMNVLPSNWSKRSPSC